MPTTITPTPATAVQEPATASTRQPDPERVAQFTAAFMAAEWSPAAAAELARIHLELHPHAALDG